MKDYILVIDSGLGGINILKSLKNELKNENFLYVLDNKSCPYGNKNKEFLVQNAIFLINKCMQKYKIKLIVFACNTLTSVAIDDVRLYLKNNVNNQKNNNKYYQNNKKNISNQHKNNNQKENKNIHNKYAIENQNIKDNMPNKIMKKIKYSVHNKNKNNAKLKNKSNKNNFHEKNKEIIKKINNFSSNEKTENVKTSKEINKNVCNEIDREIDCRIKYKLNKKQQDFYKKIDFNNYVVGTEPPIKMVDKNEETLIICTKQTLKYNKTLNENLDNENFTFISLEGIAKMVDESFFDRAKIVESLKAQIPQKSYKNIVLGCTHYYYLEENLKQVLNNPSLKFFSATNGVLKRVVKLLKLQNNFKDKKEIHEKIFEKNLEFWQKDNEKECQKNVKKTHKNMLKTHEKSPKKGQKTLKNYEKIEQKYKKNQKKLHKNKQKIKIILTKPNLKLKFLAKKILYQN